MPTNKQGFDRLEEDHRELKVGISELNTDLADSEGRLYEALYKQKKCFEKELQAKDAKITKLTYKNLDLERRLEALESGFKELGVQRESTFADAIRNNANASLDWPPPASSLLPPNYNSLFSPYPNSLLPPPFQPPIP